MNKDNNRNWNLKCWNANNADSCAFTTSKAKVIGNSSNEATIAKNMMVKVHPFRNIAGINVITPNKVGPCQFPTNAVSSSRIFTCWNAWDVQVRNHCNSDPVQVQSTLNCAAEPWSNTNNHVDTNTLYFSCKQGVGLLSFTWLFNCIVVSVRLIHRWGAHVAGNPTLSRITSS